MPQHATFKVIDDEDERNRQNKALQRWEAQKAEWDRLQRGLARRVGKPSGERTLQGSTHEFRMRTEELGMIDASVPAEVKNGVSAWEMNLRSGGGGGVRYVQVGSSYPYPLYCPIRDAESVKPDNNILMKVVPRSLPERHKPVASGEYFQSRQHEFQKHIKRKFAHYSADYFAVEGQAPPRAGAPVPEDHAVAPFTYHATEKSAQADGAADSVSLRHAKDTTGVTPASSRPLSAVIMKSGATPAPSGTVAPSGPMIVLSTAHLHFSAAPNETAQATLRIENTGSTAVFYSWSTCEGDAALPLSPVLSANSASGSPTAVGGATFGGSNAGADGLFRLSDVANAVLLPDDVKHFTVSFRSPVPGIFSQLLELLTVPAGRERIVIHLRAVVVGGTGNSALTQELDAELLARAPVVDAGALINEIVLAERDNVFDAAAVNLQVRQRQTAVQASHEALYARVAAQQQSWSTLNAPLGISWHRGLYQAFEAVNRNVHEFAAKQSPPPPPPPVLPPSRAPTPSVVAPPEEAKAKDAPVPAAPWSGGIRDLLETASSIRDAEARSIAVHGINALVAVGAAQTPDAPAEQTIAELAWIAAGRQQWGAAADRIQAAAATARDIAEGRSTVKAGQFTVAKGAEKGGKAAAPPKGKGPAQPVAPPAEVSDKLSPDARAVLTALTRRCVSDAIVGTIDARAALMDAVQKASRLPIDTTIAHRLDAALGVIDKDMEPLADAAAAKGKKK
jgi:hypothetical protein